MSLIGFSAANGYAYEFAGFDGSTTCSWSHSGVTGRNRLAVVAAVLVTPGGDSASVTATYGGTAMTLQGVRSFGSNGRQATFTLTDPPSGPQTVSVYWQSLGFTLPSKQISCGVATYRGVGLVDSYFGSGARSSSNSITTPGLVPSDYAIFMHARGSSAAFSSYNQTQRFTGATTFARLLIGDSTGSSGSATSTVTTSSVDDLTVTRLRVRRFAEADFFAG